MRRRTVGRSPWRWLIAAIGLAFAGLSLPSVFEPLPDYAEHDTFELVMFYAVPLVVGGFGLGLACIALRSGVFVDEDELVVRPCAGVRNTHLAAGSLTAVTVKHEQGPVVEWVSPAVVATNGATVSLGARSLQHRSRTSARYRSGRGHRASTQAAAGTPRRRLFDSRRLTRKSNALRVRAQPDPHDPCCTTGGRSGRGSIAGRAIRLHGWGGSPAASGLQPSMSERPIGAQLCAGAFHCMQRSLWHMTRVVGIP